MTEHILIHIDYQSQNQPARSQEMDCHEKHYGGLPVSKNRQFEKPIGCLRMT